MEEGGLKSMLDELMTKIEVLELSADEKTGKFAMGPLERGYGQTIGNSLRRIMLSSLEGSSASSEIPRGLS